MKGIFEQTQLFC